MLATLKFIVAHPLTKGRRTSAVLRFLGYQIVTRTRPSCVLPWFGGARLEVSRNMAGASGNIYCGLHEPADMGFFLHFLRPDDLFLDIGANVGSYTILASKVCGSRTIAFEPFARRLRKNIQLNNINHLVEVAEIILLEHNGEAGFTDNLDSMNHVSETGRTLPCARLDDRLQNESPIALKIDVEGSEEQVFSGAQRSLASVQALQTEMLTESIDSMLRNNGFSRVFYNPFDRELRAEPFESLKPSNALYVRNIDLVLARVRKAPKRTVLPGMRL